MTAVLESALVAAGAGLSLIPIKPDGSKRPLVAWQPYQTQPADGDQLRRWFADASLGMAVIGGAVSGNLEMLEFEGRAVEHGLHLAFREQADQLGLGDVLTRIMAGFTVESPSGGYHLIYRCEGPVEGNQKLARRPATEDELATDSSPVRVLMETRGEGGYFITAPSNGRTHESGRAWVTKAGGYDTIATITAAERAAILDLARSFDRMPREEWRPSSRRDGPGTRPGDDFNVRTTWADLLEPHGWTYVFTAGDGNQHWRRPGKRIGTSATIAENGEGPLYVFSSSTAFESERAYSRFSAYTILEHDGDFKAAAAALAAKGYGEQRGAIRHSRPRAGTGTFALTDLGNAQRLVAGHGKHIRYCPPWGCWLRWDGKRWARDDSGAVERLAKEVARQMLVDAEDLEDRTERRALIKHQLSSESVGRIRAAIDLARTEPGIPVKADELDLDPMAINCENGIVDLKTGQLRPHDPVLLMTKLAPVNYDPTAAAPVWESTLERIFAGRQELIDYVRRALGYCMSADTSEQVLFMPHGSGANGKSTVLRAMHFVLGDYALTADMTTFLETSKDGQSNGIARLQGARMVAAIEAGEGRRLNEVLVKQVTGQDKVAARYLYRESFEFLPAFKLWLATNHKPQVKGTDEAIWRRIHLVPFSVTIHEAERDRDLVKKLEAEAPGIFAWMVRGCLEWQKVGLCPPEDVRAATAAYRADMDTIGAFIADCCIVGAEFRVLAGSLYMAYEFWCDENGEKAMSQRALGQELEARGFGAARSMTGRFRTGLGLISPDDAMTGHDASSDSFSRRKDMEKKAAGSVMKRHASSDVFEPIRA